ncbi:MULTISPECIES: hypothetical protein [unclassified Clostridium]|uniref:hypothetical protein n=1 Tax=unclassified Clostridium TaxID=2614128 RepID=UPI000297B802|nr:MULTISPECIES: hypothetical protein [unclassified Clostridium]EKQ50552.1 MAG: hypothetical protein A370_05556 [Clostridium sp. Maddingley MBC34-26]
MSKEKNPYGQAQNLTPQEQIPEVHSSEPGASDIEKLKKLYLPSSKADNRPSEESIEKANGLNSSKPDTLM